MYHRWWFHVISWKYILNKFTSPLTFYNSYDPLLPSSHSLGFGSWVVDSSFPHHKLSPEPWVQELGCRCTSSPIIIYPEPWVQELGCRCTSFPHYHLFSAYWLLKTFCHCLHLLWRIVFLMRGKNFTICGRMQLGRIPIWLHSGRRFSSKFYDLIITVKWTLSSIGELLIVAKVAVSLLYL